MTGIESCRKASRDSLESIHTPEDVIDVTLPEGKLEGLTLKETVQGIHREICIGGGHLGAHSSALYLLVYGRTRCCIQVLSKVCLHDVSGQWEILVLTSVLPFIIYHYHSLPPLIIPYYPSFTTTHHASFTTMHPSSFIIHYNSSCKHSLPHTPHRSLSTIHHNWSCNIHYHAPLIIHYHHSLQLEHMRMKLEV